MGLDIRISRDKPIYCPHCGELVTYRAVDTVDGGGSSWYEFLESIGYYKPYVKGQPYPRSMYGKDLELSDEQIDKLEKFVAESDFCTSYPMIKILNFIESARIDGDKIVINADW